MDLECGACHGRPGGCGECGGRGRHEITGCPLACVPDGVWETIGLVRDMETGIPPVTGGTLNQTASFLAARRLVRGEEARIELEDLKRAGNRHGR